MASTNPQWLHWKLEGDSHCDNGKFLKAIKCYDMALHLTQKTTDASTLLLSRSSARLSFHAYDAALSDAGAALTLPPACNPPSEENERVWMLTAKALYGLRRFRECAECLEKIGGLYAAREERGVLLGRCRVRLEEEAGEYDWGLMLEEAGCGRGDMDRADYVGGVEVRLCAIEAHGRGLFTTRDVKAGDLLLCEKAFTAAFAKEGGGEVEGEEGDEEAMRLRAELATGAFVKLCRNPSLQGGFGELFAGPDADEEVDEKGKVVVDDTFVQNRITYNAFAFPLLTSTSHQQIISHPSGISTTANSRGIWLRASYINHSCYPLVRRSFIGDMMIFRAQADIPKDTELKFGYISCLEDVGTRTEMLAKYGFKCECQVCVAERGTPKRKLGKRKEITKKIITLFEKDEAVGLHTYLDLLEQIGETYTVSPTIEPRHAVVVPIMNIITGCESSSLHAQVIQLVHLLLFNLGFEFTATQDSFRVHRWGFLIDELVVALADICDAYAALEQPLLLRDAEGAAKKCYLIMCGDDVSWEAAYGAQSGRKKGDEGCGHDGVATERGDGGWRI